MRRRRNTTNTGKGFEARISAVNNIYETQRKALLRKCDPPSFSTVKNGVVRHQLLKNPFPDFVGVWTANRGRALFVEAKSTSEPRLGIMSKSGGVSINQCASLFAWHESGGAVCVVWEHKLYWKLVTVKMIQKTLTQKRGNTPRKSIRWDEAIPIPQDGVIACDYLKVLAQEYPIQRVQYQRTNALSRLLYES